jgi:hypothetical protein
MKAGAEICQRRSQEAGCGDERKFTKSHSSSAKM